MKNLCLLILACMITAHSGFAAPEHVSKPTFLFMAGSARKDSVNKKLVHNAYEIAKAAGVEATFLDLKDYPMPMYDGDLEDSKGLPKKAAALKKIFAEHDGVFIASPEYNGSFAPLLKNALDWISRGSEKGEGGLKAFEHKVIALGAASPGSGGGRSGLIPLRMMFNNISVMVIPDQITVSKAYGKFDQHGHLTDADDHAELKEVVEALIRVTTALKKTAHA